MINLLYKFNFRKSVEKLIESVNLKLGENCENFRIVQRWLVKFKSADLSLKNELREKSWKVSLTMIFDGILLGTIYYHYSSVRLNRITKKMDKWVLLVD